MTKNIFTEYKITNEEFSELQEEFGKLAKFQAWQLIKKNARNNHTDEMEDIEQDLIIAILRAGVYYKRQIYIEECLKLATNYAKDVFVKKMVEELNSLWDNRTKHGANKQKYGELQERLLDNIVKKVVPSRKRPKKNKKLVIDAQFARYCKQIAWNQQKSMGKKITKERSIRSGMVSLATFDFSSSEIT